MSEPNPYEPPTGTTDDKSPRPRRNFKAAVGIVASAFIGFGVWALSPLLTGQTEPWDAGGYYILSLLIGGGIVGCCTPGRVNDTLRVLGACFGAWAGQLLAAGLFVNGPLAALLLIGSVSTGLGTGFLFLPGFIMGSGIGFAIRPLIEKLTGEKSRLSSSRRGDGP